MSYKEILKDKLQSSIDAGKYKKHFEKLTSTTESTRPPVKVSEATTKAPEKKEEPRMAQKTEAPPKPAEKLDHGKFVASMMGRRVPDVEKSIVSGLDAKFKAKK